MFCHQCQETMKNTGCNMKQGMCGKSAEVADLQDLFIWGLKGMSAYAEHGPSGCGQHQGLWDP